MASDCPSGGWEGCEGSDSIDGSFLDFVMLNGKHGIVIDGVVSWILNQLDCVAEEIWFNLAMDCFSDKEISAGKEALLKACKENVDQEIRNRQGNKKKRAELKDIALVLNSLRTSGKLPLILATGKMMKRAPNSTGIPKNPSNSDIATRVSLLESSLSSFMKQQLEQMRNLTDVIGSSTATAVTTSVQRPPIFRNAVQSVVSMTDSPNKRKRTEEPLRVVHKAHAPQPTNTEPTNGTPLVPSFAAVTSIGNHFNPVRQSQNVQGINRLNNNAKPPPRRQSVMYGTSKTGKDDNVELLAADVTLVAMGVSKEASDAQLKGFLENKGISVISVEKLTKPEAETRTNTFKVVVKLSDYEKAMQPDIWPYRVGVRHYRPPKRSLQGPSWQQQSSMAGGIVQSQDGNNKQASSSRSNASRATVPSVIVPQSSPFNLDLQNKYQALTDNSDEIFVN